MALLMLKSQSVRDYQSIFSTSPGPRARQVDKIPKATPKVERTAYYETAIDICFLATVISFLPNLNALFELYITSHCNIEFGRYKTFPFIFRFRGISKFFPLC